MDDLTTPKARRIERGIDEQLRELAEKGELSGLPGEGRPLPEDADADAGDAWAARHVVRNASVVPEWVDLRKEIHTGHGRIVTRLRRHRAWLEERTARLRDLPADRIVESARATRERDERVRAEILAGLADLNALVARHNLLVVMSLQIAPLSLERIEDQAARSPR